MVSGMQNCAVSLTSAKLYHLEADTNHISVWTAFGKTTIVVN